MTACDCSCSIDEYGSNDFYSVTNPVARKPHVCCECRQTIQPGQRYHRASGKSDGRCWSMTTCAPCAAIRAHYCPHGFLFGDLRQTLIDCLGLDYLDPRGGEEDDG